VVGKRLALAILLAACTRDRPPTTEAPVDPLAPLRAFETDRRSHTAFLDQPASDAALGADPYDLVALPNGTFAGILRGRDALVLLDASLHETARIAMPRSPSAIAVHDGDVYVTSEAEPVIAHVRGGERLPDIPLDGVLGARAIVVDHAGTIHVAEERDDRVVSLGKHGRTERKVARGPMRLASAGDTIYVASVIGHAITASDGATATFDGPIWSIAASGNIVVATGVEDHPLDRTGGFFGYVDSFVYVLFHGPHGLERIASINASELGVVVPKAVAFTASDRAFVAAYGSAKALRLAWKDGPHAPPAIEVVDALPGTSALAVSSSGALVAANPLLDAWVGVEPRSVVHVEADSRAMRTRIGEALFFTDLMAPANKSDGALSRFTCETCHFEGYVDGRTHHTGRGDVHATTKPLLGLFNNRPHFSRALDPDLSAVAENEFRVAGAHSDTDPHFTVDATKTTWIRELGVPDDARIGPEELRLALMDFLMTFAPRESPWQGKPFGDRERAGAAVFRDRCERCHQARASADDETSRVPFERWEPLSGRIVWASNVYEKTGIMPYVHDNGARVPSLRRLYKKRPYFTNGSAPTIRAVLERARFSPFTHDGSGDGESLNEDQMRALEAFLDRL